MEVAKSGTCDHYTLCGARGTSEAMTSRKPFLLVGDELISLQREPEADGAHPTFVGPAPVCTNCKGDLSEATWSAYINLFFCTCGYLFGLRFRPAHSHLRLVR